MSPPTVSLRCPHCDRPFDYDYLPGGSFTAVRLGSSRYMRCPLCRRFAIFDLRGEGRRETPAAADVPTFSDRQHLVRWLAIFLIPAAGAVTALGLLLAHPEPALGAVLAGSAAIGVVSLLLVYLGSLPARRSDPDR